ncbi:unnamed protein product [Tuber aestivum]|uniref:Uncharacterized protein n=1 Tax=Tuber aestivum TaxID=59557 RepID=A0A292Q760_9PEZI|nr:unnamed protein product [Tuber aestivum]
MLSRTKQERCDRVRRWSAVSCETYLPLDLFYGCARFAGAVVLGRSICSYLSDCAIRVGGCGYGTDISCLSFFLSFFSFLACLFTIFLFVQKRACSKVFPS